MSFNIPDDFDSKIYIKLNRDLSHMTDLQATEHYKYTGFLEDRKYKYCQFDLNYNVYIYCCGKSGSSTLHTTFIKNRYHSLHLHGIKYYKIHLAESNINPNIFEVIEESMKNNENVYIIDSYRLPIERKISSFFQNQKL